MNNSKYIQRLIISLIVTVFFLLLNTNAVNAFADKITAFRSSGTLKYNGYDFMPYKDAKYSDSYKAAFCTRFKKTIPSKNQKCTKTDSWSNAIRAGVAAIIANYKGGGDRTTYYYTELAINCFLYDHNGKNSYNRISTTRNNKTILGNYYSFYEAGEKQYNKVSKKLSLNLSSNSLTFTKNGNNYDSQTITVSDTNSVKDSGFSASVTSCSNCNAEIINKNSKSFQVRIKNPSAASHTVKVKVTGKRTYKVAREYKCTDDKKQRLTPNHTENNTETSDKSISGTINIQQQKHKITVKKYDFDNQDTSLAGAKFALSKGNSFSGNTCSKNNNNEYIGFKNTDNNGTVVWNSLEDGCYVLEEVNVPEGYIPPTVNSWIVVLKGSDQTVTVYNRKQSNCDSELEQIKNTFGSDPNSQNYKHYQDALEQLNERIKNREVNSSCRGKKGCTALLKENQDATNYGACEVAKYSCETKLKKIEQEYTNDHNETKYETALKKLYDEVFSGSVSSSCPNNNCTALLKENRGAINYGKCDQATTCDNQLRIYLNSRYTAGEETLRKNLYNLWAHYYYNGDINYSGLLDVSNPKCQTPVTTVNPSCEYNEVKKDIEVPKSSEHSKAVCTVEYKMFSPIFKKGNVTAGQLLWSSDLPATGIIDISCNNVGTSSETYIDVDFDNIDLNLYVDENNKHVATFRRSVTKKIPSSIINSPEISEIIEKGQAKEALSIDSKKIRVPYISGDRGLRTYRTLIYVEFKYSNNWYSAIGSGTLFNDRPENHDYPYINLGGGVPINLSTKTKEENKRYSDYQIKWEFPKNTLSDASIADDQSGNDGETSSIVDDTIINTCPYEVEDSLVNDYQFHSIDTSAPFSGGVNGLGRNTGNNWCTFSTEQIGNASVNDNDERCSANNEMVQKYIKDRPNSNSSNDYIMYSITLTPDDLKKIRSYNSEHEYNDFTNLRCNHGQDCVSSFLTDVFKKTYVSNSRGYCIDTNNHRKKICVPKSLESSP